MAKKRSGLLLVLMQPPTALEEEFNAWYDTEHLSERLALPGFKSALRFICLSGYPRYCAMYDLDSLAALETPDYRATSGANDSPWTASIVRRVKVYRVPAEQVYPGHVVTRRSSRVLLVKLRALAAKDEDAVVKMVRSVFEKRPETTALRVFAAKTGKSVDYFCWVEMTPPPAAEIDLQALGRFARHVDIVNLYAPYDPAG
jgi:hypothetical protein